MRRQDTWLDLADRLGLSRVEVVAVCAFLNMRRPAQWIARNLDLPLSTVNQIAEPAKPLIRQSRRHAVGGDYVCAYCGTERELTKDHVIPRSRGGSNEPDNIVWACRNCNSAKGNRTPGEWLRCI